MGQFSMGSTAVERSCPQGWRLYIDIDILNGERRQQKKRVIHPPTHPPAVQRVFAWVVKNTPLCSTRLT
jgi:hypothetical protein